MNQDWRDVEMRRMFRELAEGTRSGRIRQRWEASKLHKPGPLTRLLRTALRLGRSKRTTV